MVRFLILCSVKIHLDTVQECHFNSISFPHYLELCVVLNATFIGGAIAKRAEKLGMDRRYKFPPKTPLS